MKLRRILIVAVLGFTLAGCKTGRHDDGVDGLGLSILVRDQLSRPDR